MFFPHYPVCSYNSKNKQIFLISIATPISKMELLRSVFIATDFSHKASFEINSEEGVSSPQSIFLCLSCDKQFGDNENSSFQRLHYSVKTSRKIGCVQS